MSNLSGRTAFVVLAVLAVVFLGVLALVRGTGVELPVTSAVGVSSLNVVIFLSMGIALVAGSLLLLNRRLRARYEERTKALKRSKESVRQVIDMVPDLVYVMDKSGHFLLYNRSVAESLGVPIKKLKGKRLVDVHPHAEEVSRILADNQTVLDSNIPKVSLEESFTDHNGRLRWLQATRMPYTTVDTSTPAVLTMAADITSRRKHTVALRASEEKFRAVFNQTFQFTGILDDKGTLLDANDAAMDVWGADKVELGAPLWEAAWWAGEESLSTRLKNAVIKAAAGSTVRFEASHTLADGSVIHTDFSLKPARDDEGSILFLLAEERDVTSLKQAEENLRRLNEELEKRVAERTMHLEEAKRALEDSLESLRTTQKELISSEKMASLGGLVAGVAHEINTPLGIGVTASTYLAQKLDAVKEKFRTNTLKKSDLEGFFSVADESSVSIIANLTRAAGLIRSFKQVSADQSSEQQRLFNVRKYLDEVLVSLGPKYKNTPYEVVNDCDPDVEIFSYPGAFMHIITNLLLNTLHHGFEGRDTGRVVIRGHLESGEFVLVFQDDGKGLHQDQLDKIFQPFYTTKQGAGGTGLGLHIVFNIVTRTLGGTIGCESEPDKGTAFIIRIPATVETNEA